MPSYREILICSVAQKTLEIVCAFQIGYMIPFKMLEYIYALLKDEI